MTLREKAIIEAYTGMCTLVGDEISEFYKYANEIMGRPVYTHELADKAIQEELREKSRIDFMTICRRKEADNRYEEKTPVFKEQEGVVAADYADGTGEMKITRYADWLCPICGWFVGERYLPRMHSQQRADYCSRCGQAIDWTNITREEYEASRERSRELREQYAFKYNGGKGVQYEDE